MEFSDAEFMTADEKRLVLKQWERFVSSGFEQRYFTDRIYKHLTLHCSFIAHYSRAGFYDVYFEEKENTRSFIDQFTTGVSTEYGMRYWLNGEYSDINRAMCRVMTEHAPAITGDLERAIGLEYVRAAHENLSKFLKNYVKDDDME